MYNMKNEYVYTISDQPHSRHVLDMWVFVTNWKMITVSSSKT